MFKIIDDNISSTCSQLKGVRSHVNRSFASRDNYYSLLYMLETLSICEITDEEESPDRTNITSVHIIKERLNFWCDYYHMGDLPLSSPDGSAYKQYLNCAPKLRKCQKWRPLPSAFYTSTDFLTQQLSNYTPIHIRTFCFAKIFHMLYIHIYI